MTSLHDLPEDCLNHIAKYVVKPDLLHPVCIRARQAAQVATASKAFRIFTEQHLYPTLASECPAALQTWPYPGEGNWDEAEHLIPRMTISKLKPILRAAKCKVTGRKADLVARLLQATPKAGKHARFTVQKETRRQLGQTCSASVLQEYKMTFDDLHRADGSYIIKFRDMVEAAAEKYGSDQGLRDATFLHPAYSRRAMCACGGYHTVSDDEYFDDTDDSLFWSEDEDSEDEEMLDAQVHLAGFMAAAIANPYWAPAFGY